MDVKKRKRLEAAGFAVGSAADFLDPAPAEAALVDMRPALSAAPRGGSREPPPASTAAR